MSRSYSVGAGVAGLVLRGARGRSAHLELGWAVGQGKKTAVLLDDPVTPELMYKMVDYLAPNVHDLLGWLGVED